ncbi:cation-translocating P-type ATPase C-terminal domain-containing protein [Nocardia vinacea]|uniref:cation-translocating P-type ATPase C-terminal domain-containing protein n=1 Tax=Nocardia vinacea TaxID=96468 RepID=UPI00340C56C1
MDKPPRPATENVVLPRMLGRGYGLLGGISTVLVLAGFFLTLYSGGWHPGVDATVGAPLHHTYLQATTMTFLGIVACQLGTGLGARTESAPLRTVGLASNPLLLCGMAFEVAFSRALVYLPPLAAIFDLAAPTPGQLALLLGYPPIGWGVDELRKARRPVGIGLARYRPKRRPDGTKARITERSTSGSWTAFLASVWFTEPGCVHWSDPSPSRCAAGCPAVRQAVPASRRCRVRYIPGGRGWAASGNAEQSAQPCGQLDMQLLQRRDAAGAPKLEQSVGGVRSNRRDRQQPFAIERIEVDTVAGDRTEGGNDATEVATRRGLSALPHGSPDRQAVPVINARTVGQPIRVIDPQSFDQTVERSCTEFDGRFSRIRVASTVRQCADDLAGTPSESALRRTPGSTRSSRIGPQWISPPMRMPRRCGRVW